MTKNELTIIAAASTNNIIGLDNKLVWDIPRDLKRFKDLTLKSRSLGAYEGQGHQTHVSNAYT